MALIPEVNDLLEALADIALRLKPNDGKTDICNLNKTPETQNPLRPQTLAESCRTSAPIKSCRGKHTG